MGARALRPIVYRVSDAEKAARALPCNLAMPGCFHLAWMPYLRSARPLRRHKELRSGRAARAPGVNEVALLHMFGMTIVFAATAMLGTMPTLAIPCQAAENLRLKEGVSFVHDLNQGFPILGDKIDDVTLAATHPTLVFFGASGDLNTNRQAKRIVDMYKKYRTSGLKFIVVDVDHPANTQTKQLIKSYYEGYIPGEVLFDKNGKSVWKKSGEVETVTLTGLIDKQL